MTDKITRAHWPTALLGILMLVAAGSARAAGDGLCEAFKGGVVAPEKLQAMLAAAQDGHLYRIRNSASEVGFCVDGKLAHIKARFHRFQGGVSLWPGAGEHEQAMIGIQTASIDAGNQLTDHLLTGKDFFDVKRYPQILFVSTGIEWNSDSTAVLKGNLTLHGVTRPVALEVHLTSIEKEADGKVEKLIAKAGTTINRADFGMGRLSALVDEHVNLCLTVEAERYQTPQGSRGKGAMLQASRK